MCWTKSTIVQRRKQRSKFYLIRLEGGYLQVAAFINLCIFYVYKIERSVSSMYTYSKLKEGLYGANGKPARDFTPNAIKAIFISGRFIFIAYHTKVPKVIPLDTQEVSKDLNSNGSNGSLVNLLKQSQMSCIEEVYVDSIFQNYKGLLDLDAYVSNLISTKSRLRFYGYCQSIDPNELYSKFNEAKIKGMHNYAYALDKSRNGAIVYTKTDNPQWFKKYNLRPNIYPMDSDNGTLSRYFHFVENALEKEVESRVSAIEKQGLNEAIVQLYTQDVNNLLDINMFFALRKLISKGKKTPESTAALQCVNDTFSKMSPIKLSRMDLQTYLNNKVPPNKSILTLYEGAFKVLSDKNSDLKFDESLVQRVNSGSGLSGFSTAFCEALVQLSMKCLKEKSNLQIAFIVALMEQGVQASNEPLPEIVSNLAKSEGGFHKCLLVLMSILGYNEKTLLEEKRKGGA